jgi:hypothetical protein
MPERPSASRTAVLKSATALRPVADSERELVLYLLAHRALNEAGIALACEDLRPSFLARARLVLDTLAAEGKIVHSSPDVWELAKDKD